jgi:steroid delta-isomerase-like uncharacterized protein
MAADLIGELVTRDFVLDFAQQWLEAWNSRDPSRVAALCSEDVRWKDPALPEPHIGRAAVHEFAQNTFTAFPDLRFEQTALPLLSDEGPRALAPYRLSGTMLGPFEPFAPTGAKIAIEGVDDWSFRDGQLSAYDTFYDSVGMARQLGVMPPAGSGAERAMARLQHVQARFQRAKARRRPR